jgi:hypothetical protein
MLPVAVEDEIRPQGTPGGGNPRPPQDRSRDVTNVGELTTPADDLALMVGR